MMRNPVILFLCLVSLVVTGCGPGERKVNGRSNRVASESVKKIKNYLPTEQRVPFETGYWVIKDKYGDSDEFLDAVDDKTVPEIIETGKAIFDERKAQGYEKYSQFASWDDMIAQMIKEREAQAIPYQPPTEKDKQNNVLYKLDSL